MMAFWPEIRPRSAAAFSAFFAGLPLSPFSARGALSPFGALAPAGFSSFSAIDLDSRALGEPHLLAVATFTDELEADAGRLAVPGIHQRQIGQVHRRLL